MGTTGNRYLLSLKARQRINQCPSLSLSLSLGGHRLTRLLLLVIIAGIQSKPSAQMDSDNSDFVFVHFPQRKKGVKKAVAWEYVSSPKDKVFETLSQKFSLWP